MHFLIDGVYGDLYRTAMLYPKQRTAADEWEAERRMAKTGEPTRRQRHLPVWAGSWWRAAGILAALGRKRPQSPAATVSEPKALA